MLFGYSYPNEKDHIPEGVMNRLLEATRDEKPPGTKVCRGPNVSQKGYGTALREWGYADARLRPHGPLTKEQRDQLPRP